MHAGSPLALVRFSEAGSRPRPRGYTSANPSGGATALVAILAAAAAGGGVWWWMRRQERSRPITSPFVVVEAKHLLQQATEAAPPQSAPLRTALVGVDPYTAEKGLTAGQITPAFTRSLAQFQAAINALMTPAKRDELEKETGYLPAYPMRTDGVLDQTTFEWLIATQF